MSEDPSAETYSRPRRRCQKQTKTPDPSYYLGYVDDEETPEMIMKKFEALERLQQNKANQRQQEWEESRGENTDLLSETLEGVVNECHNSNEPEVTDGYDVSIQLTAEEQAELFKQTSFFTVNMLKDGGETIAALQDEYYDDPAAAFSELIEVSDSEDEEVWSDSDEDELWLEHGHRSKSKPKGMRNSASLVHASRPLAVRSSAFNALIAWRRRRRQLMNVVVREAMPPDPLPRSWAIPILPLSSLTISEKKGKSFQCVYMDPPWSENLRPCDVASLKGLHHILPFGFVFVWVEKWMIPEVIQVFEAKGFNYVENVCWIHKNVNNKIRESDYRYFRICHSTLLVLRKLGKTSAETIQLQHQRNPDVVYDFPCWKKSLSESLPRQYRKPTFVYHIIETLLPDGLEKLLLLELWCEAGYHRNGWISIAHQPSLHSK
ncbi:hypothetical protein Gasu2_09940 [Galdieria sulphuraria]|nr:hypothetical protein Gasu2_09940 [Galdieria sulphuraria]